MSKNKTYEGALDPIEETGGVAAGAVGMEAEAPQEDKPVPDTEATQEAEQTVYVGPNVLPLALRRFQVFRGGLPLYVERAIEKIPEVRPLIVPVSKLNEASTKTAKPGTNEFRLYEAVKKAAEGVR